MLESYVTKKSDKKAAPKFMKKAIHRYASPNEIVTGRLRSYSAAAEELGCADEQITQRWANNLAENSHLPFQRRERAMLQFRRMRSLQKFASIHTSFHNLFNSQRPLSKRFCRKVFLSLNLPEFWLDLCSQTCELFEWRSMVYL